MLLAASEEFDNLDADEDGIMEAEELREFCPPTCNKTTRQTDPKVAKP